RVCVCPRSVRPLSCPPPPRFAAPASRSRGVLRHKRSTRRGRAPPATRCHRLVRPCCPHWLPTQGPSASTPSVATLANSTGRGKGIGKTTAVPLLSKFAGIASVVLRVERPPKRE